MPLTWVLVIYNLHKWNTRNKGAVEETTPLLVDEKGQQVSESGEWLSEQRECPSAVSWVGSVGGYSCFDLTVSTYLMTLNLTVFLSGHFASMPCFSHELVAMHFRAADSLFGRDAGVLSHLVRWHCAILAFAGALFLIGTHFLGSQNKLCKHGAAITTCLCFVGYVSMRFYAMFVRRSDAHHAVLAVDWSLLAISVALLARSYGVNQTIYSCWLRKTVLISLAALYSMSALQKQVSSGFAWQGTQHGPENLLRIQMWVHHDFSVWPWFNDTVILSDSLGPAIGWFTFLFEGPCSFLVLIGLCTGSELCRYVNLNIYLALWAVVAILFHFGIWCLLHPVFPTYAYALLFLVLDPFAMLRAPGQKIDAISFHSRSDARGFWILFTILVMICVGWVITAVYDVWTQPETQDLGFFYSEMSMYSDVRGVPPQLLEFIANAQNPHQGK